MTTTTKSTTPGQLGRPVLKKIESRSATTFAVRSADGFRVNTLPDDGRRNETDTEWFRFIVDEYDVTNGFPRDSLGRDNSIPTTVCPLRLRPFPSSGILCVCGGEGNFVNRNLRPVAVRRF